MSRSARAPVRHRQPDRGAAVPDGSRHPGFAARLDGRERRVRRPRRRRSGTAPGSARPRSAPRSPELHDRLPRTGGRERTSRSTSSATPDRPSERSAAYTANPRARRENSGVQSIWSRPAPVLGDEVLRREPHGGAVGLRVCDEREPAVVRDVEPLVRVRRPGVRLLGARRQVSELGGRSRPTARTRRRRAATLPPRAQSAAISSSGSKAPVFTSPACAQTMVGTVAPRSAVVQRVSLHAALPVDLETRPSQRLPSPSSRSARSIVMWRFPPRQDRDRRRSRETVRLHVPADALEHGVTSGGETRDVRHLAARDERERRGRRDPEQILEPLACHLFDDSRRRPTRQRGRRSDPRPT